MFNSINRKELLPSDHGGEIELWPCRGLGFPITASMKYTSSLFIGVFNTRAKLLETHVSNLWRQMWEFRTSLHVDLTRCRFVAEPRTWVERGNTKDQNRNSVSKHMQLLLSQWPLAEAIGIDYMGPQKWMQSCRQAQGARAEPQPET